MTSPSAKPFEEITDAAYGDAFAAGCSIVPSRRGYRLTGTCPRCDHPMTLFLPTEIILGRRSVEVPSGEAICTCRDDHSGRPAGEEGCGAYWNVAISEASS